MKDNPETSSANYVEEKILQILCDLANALEAAATNIKHSIAETIGLGEEKTYDPNNIRWEQAQGQSGPYERSEDVASPDFKQLIEDLTTHQGKVTRDGCFYWLFKNGLTVGRKKR